MTKIEELEAALEAATPGEWTGINPKTKKFKNTPWRADNEQASSTMSAPITVDGETVALFVTDDWDMKEELHANIAFTALAHNTMPLLLKVVTMAQVAFEVYLSNGQSEEPSAMNSMLDLEDALGRLK